MSLNKECRFACQRCHNGQENVKRRSYLKPVHTSYIMKNSYWKKTEQKTGIWGRLENRKRTGSLEQTDYYASLSQSTIMMQATPISAPSPKVPDARAQTDQQSPSQELYFAFTKQNPRQCHRFLEDCREGSSPAHQQAVNGEAALAPSNLHVIFLCKGLGLSRITQVSWLGCWSSSIFLLFGSKFSQTRVTKKKYWYRMAYLSCLEGTKRQVGGTTGRGSCVLACQMCLSSTSFFASATQCSHGM